MSKFFYKISEKNYILKKYIKQYNNITFKTWLRIALKF